MTTHLIPEAAAKIRDLIVNVISPNNVDAREAITLLDDAPKADLIPQDELFVCGQMGANVTRVYAQAPQAAPKESDHETTGECWCNPTLDYKDPATGAEVWIHNKPQ